MGQIDNLHHQRSCLVSAVHSLCPDSFEAEKSKPSQRWQPCRAQSFSLAEDNEPGDLSRVTCTFDSSVDAFTNNEARCNLCVRAHCQQKLRNRHSGNEGKDSKRLPEISSRGTGPK